MCDEPSILDVPKEEDVMMVDNHNKYYQNKGK
jgi:hypothetical protein